MMLHDPTHLYEGKISPRAEKLALVISSLTYPPFLSALAFIVLSLRADDPVNALVSMILSVSTAAIIPTASIRYYARKFGNEDGDVSRREDRIRPLIVGITSYFVGVVSLFVAGAPWVCTVMMMSYATSTIIVLLINTKWKISVHATGCMGPATMMAMVYPPWGALLLLLIIPVAWSRYVRRKHTPAQLVGGAVFGSVYTALFLAIML